MISQFMTDLLSVFLASTEYEAAVQELMDDHMDGMENPKSNIVFDKSENKGLFISSQPK